MVERRERDIKRQSSFNKLHQKYMRLCNQKKANLN